MSSPVLIRLLLILMMVFVCGLASSGFAQKTIACGSGGSAGSITCESDQEGYCAVSDGKVRGRCKSTPAGLKGRDLELYVLSEALGRKVSSAELDQSEELKRALREGRLKTSGEVITFRPIDEIEKSERGEIPPYKPLNPSDSTRMPRGISCTICISTGTRERCETISGNSQDELKASAIEKICGTDSMCVQATRNPSNVTVKDCKQH